MSDIASKGNVQSVAGNSAQCHTVTPAQCTVSLVAKLEQSGANQIKPPLFFKHHYLLIQI
jgi:hypothetical protein